MHGFVLIVCIKLKKKTNKKRLHINYRSAFATGKFAKLQRLTCIAITGAGAMHSTTSQALDAIFNLPALQEYAPREVERNALRLHSPRNLLLRDLESFEIFKKGP